MEDKTEVIVQWSNIHIDGVKHLNGAKVQVDEATALALSGMEKTITDSEGNTSTLAAVKLG